MFWCNPMWWRKLPGKSPSCPFCNGIKFLAAQIFLIVSIRNTWHSSLDKWAVKDNLLSIDSYCCIWIKLLYTVYLWHKQVLTVYTVEGKDSPLSQVRTVQLVTWSHCVGVTLSTDWEWPETLTRHPAPAPTPALHIFLGQNKVLTAGTTSSTADLDSF